MIAHISELLTTKKISCTELTQTYLDAIKKEDKALNAYITMTPEEALTAAKAVDTKLAAGEALRPLEGIPMTLKDNISTKGIATTCASKILTGYKPIYDATVWQLLQKQNAVLLGKTNMDEFAMGSTCESSYYGGAVNPHNTKHVAGGSSGGGAAAVAGNLAVYALGSDTGGSIRQPASFCGIVGLKPTYGAVSRFGLIAYASSLDQIGPITTSVEDAALVYDAIAQYDPMDSTSQGSKASASASLKNSIKGMRIGIPKEYYDGLSDDVRSTLETAIKVYESLGAEIVRFALPSVQYALPVYYILACAEATSNLGRYDGIRYGYQATDYSSVHEMISKTRSEGFGAEVKRRIMLGNYVLSSGYYDAYYKKAQNLRGTIVQAFRDAYQICDVILTPTVPATASERGQTHSDPTEDYLNDICTVPVNIAGLPAVSVPCGFDAKGLPIGMQLIGNTFDEARVLNAAYAYEQETSNFKAVETGVRL
ncbi:Asp-tRNA(Asn)/Glu-tRNA(Gln) amidotransferase subunit GatA [Oscillospiraceae bacterium PP1C4]